MVAEPAAAGVGFVTVPGGPTADDGAGFAAGEVVAVAGGWLFINSLRRLLVALLLSE